MNEIDFINKWSPNGFENPYPNYCFKLDLEEYREQIRAEVIEECIKLQLDMSCVENCIHMVDCTECMAEKMEQLKEQNK